MQCPSEIMTILLEILQAGILRCRAAGWEGDADRAALEADHIHNLPALVKNYSPDLLKYYWEVERPSFIDQSSGIGVAEFERLWQQLRCHVEEATLAKT